MKILAVDTSSVTASAAVMSDGMLLGECTYNDKKTHSQKIMVMIETLFAELDLKAEDVDIFAAATGPGSFTGLRIGVATIKALAHATGKKTAGVSTLEGLAYNLPYSEHIIVPIMDARNNNVYCGTYIWDGDTMKSIDEDAVMTIEECVEGCGNLLDVVFTGDGVNVYRKYIEEKLGDKAHFAPANALCQRASSVAVCAMRMAEEGKTTEPDALLPKYLRKSQAEQEAEKQKNNKN